jgi:hypothetical protein
MANIFPRGSNILPIKILICLLVLGPAVTAGMWYYFTPKYTRVGYQPAQPVPFSHKIHAGQLGLDCRYCHSFAETAAHSNVPTAQVCMNCHSQVQKDNPKLEPVRQAFATGQPVHWVQIHKTPDHAFFNHSVHVNRGISCVSCHGRVDQMDEVYHAESHAMKFCLDCHRAPEAHLRPLDKVTDLGWQAAPKGKESAAQAQLDLGNALKSQRGVNPPVNNCAGCHR